MIMSDSQVSLVSMDMEGKNREQVLAMIQEKQRMKAEQSNDSDASVCTEGGFKLHKRKPILRQTSATPGDHKRRVSLQESHLSG